MEQGINENKKLSFDKFLVLFGGEHHIGCLYEVQTYLMHYLGKLEGKSSREQAEQFNVSHTTANEQINKGEECYKSLTFLMHLIDERLKEVNKSYVTHEYILKGLMLEMGVPKDKLQETFEAYVKMEMKERGAKENNG